MDEHQHKRHLIAGILHHMFGDDAHRVLSGQGEGEKSLGAGCLKTMSWLGAGGGAELVAPPSQPTPTETNRPLGCSCNWPHLHYRSRSGHHHTCPVHVQWWAEYLLSGKGRGVKAMPPTPTPPPPAVPPSPFHGRKPLPR